MIDVLIKTAFVRWADLRKKRDPLLVVLTVCGETKKEYDLQVCQRVEGGDPLEPAFLRVSGIGGQAGPAAAPGPRL